MTSFSKPTSDVVDAAIPKISSPQHERYFFDRLENPYWIEPLAERGLFLHPPSPEDVGGGRVRCRTWPQSRYLVRMAASAPEAVAPAFAKLETDNWTIVADMVEAAKAMPGPNAAQIAKVIGDHIARLGLWHLLDDVGTVIANLVEGGETRAAIALFGQAFAIDRRRSAGRIRRSDDYGYFEGLRDSAIPSLARVKGEELIRRLLRSLMSAMEAEDGRRACGDDFSYIWRPAIEEHEQNRDYDFAAKLVGCVRDACEIAIRGGGLALASVLGLLGNDSLIQRRIRIHLINEFAEVDRPLACATMLDRDLFNDYGVKHEYARLVRDRFALLTQPQQADWLAWIDSGPEEELDDDADASVIASRREYWQFQRLHWVRQHLSGERREFYDRMHAEHGEPHLADLNTYSADARWGHDSPYSAEDLVQLDFSEAVATVTAWRPGPDDSRFDGPTVEGLKQAFRVYVATDPTAFSAHARLLIDRPACYVRSFLESLEAGVKERKDIDLDAVLELCAWIVDQPLEENTSPGTKHERLVDRDWQWCRDTVADLLQEVCKSKAGDKPRYPIDRREAMWSIIARLPEVPPKMYVVREEAEDDPRVADWPLLALNSPRGKAMHAVLAYADWIADHEVTDRSEHRAFPGGFDAMPEVRALLESQLTRPDRHFTETAVFGWRFGLLYWLDADWLRAHADRIFELRKVESAPSSAFGWAAWNTFLFSHRPHVEFYRILREQFSYAVDHAVALSEPQESREQPFARLGEHLIVIYGRGDLGAAPEEAWVADDRIIQRLVTSTHASVRTHAVEFVGQSLQGSEGDLPDPVLERFRFLWEQYWEAGGEADATADPDSRVFGYWFSSGAFDAGWSLQQMEAFVSAAPKADPDHMILERLAALAQGDPARCARIVGALVDGDDEGWRISSWEDEARTVLSIALQAGGDAATIARGVIDRLGRRGFLDFGKLLSHASGT